MASRGGKARLAMVFPDEVSAPSASMAPISRKSPRASLTAGGGGGSSQFKVAGSRHAPCGEIKDKAGKIRRHDLGRRKSL